MIKANIPEQGQLVQVRNRFFLVLDVHSEFKKNGADMPNTKLTLECIDDDRPGEQVELIWELEVHKQVFSEIAFPFPKNWDSLNKFEAFIHAINWSSSSLVDVGKLLSPFRGAVELEEYQLEPVVRALGMPRVNLLLADDVGLGKTIEAGFIIQELMAHQRIRRILIICPASLQRQWQEEMLEKFNLEFKIIDRDEIFKLRKEYGLRVNPWNSYPRLITSMDFFKREQILNLFKDSLKSESRQKGLRDWDLLVVDEAHNLAPAGQKDYVRDSDRTIMARAIVDDFENRLFLTATPHNGFTYSFTALLEMLDPLRFSRGLLIDPAQRDAVMIRRIKDDIITELASTKFAKRIVRKIEIALPEDDQDPDQLLLTTLDAYRNSRLNRAKGREIFPIRFTMTLLKKRLLSSPLAFFNSLEVHINHITKPGEIIREDKRADDALFKNIQQKASDDWDDDQEKVIYEEQAVQEGSKFFGELTPTEESLLTKMWQASEKLTNQADKKACQLIEWIKSHLLENDSWNSDRLVIFTEYKDTLAYIENILKQFDDSGRILKLYGGLATDERETIKAAFQAPPTENPMRILLATDAASEGLNLQNHCRYLIHYEIPWNPNKMEQRNGRIDRHGQKAKQVFCHHFVYRNHEDSEFLQVIVDKMTTQRVDIGAIGDLLELEIEKQMLGEKADLDIYQKRLQIVKEETRAELQLKHRIEIIRKLIDKAQMDLEINPETMRCVVEQGLKLALNRADYTLVEKPLSGQETGYWAPSIPENWADVHRALKTAKGLNRTIVFDAEAIKNHKNLALIHLNHPLMLRAVSVFRANMWALDGFSKVDLNRVSYKVVPDQLSTKPLLIGIGRLVITNFAGQKLYEHLYYYGAFINENMLEMLTANDSEKFMKMPGQHPKISIALADYLRRYHHSHVKILMEQIKAKEASGEVRVKELLKTAAEQNAREIRKLITDRIKEIEKRLADVAKERQRLQLEFKFDPDENEQFDQDIRWLEKRKEQLKTELTERPEQIKAQYKIKQTRIYPLGLLYVIPEAMVTAYA